MFTKYGYNTISFVSLICLLFIAIGIFSANGYVRLICVALAVLLMAFTLNFFRDPERLTPAGDKDVVSPADGKVIIIKNVTESRFINGEAVQVSIFMSPMNVHVNRIPVSGTVGYAKYVPGKFLPAFEDKASEENERSEIGINSPLGKIFYTQVAGYVARRIVFDLKEGQQVTKGERFGMIKFGSRVDIIAPKGFQLAVKVGDVTRAGETVIFKHAD